ncbi:MAG TPA: ABC transporter ATP-binding protein [Reyranella sp.]|nr:ABC transporter ATP-binding protein [Reyranella sp.]
MSDALPLVRFAGVSKSYDGGPSVVNGLDLDIRRGEFLTLLGPSGSGKTTTLMMLAGFEAPTVGRILLSGRDITELPPYKRGIGVVFQNYALFPHMSVGENVAYPLKLRGLVRSTIESKVAKALATVRLEGLENRRPAQLSGGQQQRVALARAMVFEPELVLLDEPLGALDKQLRERMQIELKTLHERLGVTMVYVTHDQSEALTMSDRIAVFADGRIRQLGTPVEVYEQPADDFVASFIGENNRFDGKVLGREGERLVVELVGGVQVRSLAGKDVADGDPVVFGVRPERVRLDTAGCENWLRLPIESVVYVGDTSRLILAWPGGGEFTVKLDRAAAIAGFSRGDTVEIGWRAEDCLVFPRRQP